ncbi:MAG: hypothetical protein MZU97_09115 [Bacillus subtilis]|nr:hypothetical protein [Bacillus subtilis]
MGQGLSIANGMALGLKLDNKASRVFALLGDGENQERTDMGSRNVRRLLQIR